MTYLEYTKMEALFKGLLKEMCRKDRMGVSEYVYNAAQNLCYELYGESSCKRFSHLTCAVEGRYWCREDFEFCYKEITDVADKKSVVGYKVTFIEDVEVGIFYYNVFIDKDVKTRKYFKGEIILAAQYGSESTTEALGFWKIVLNGYEELRAVPEESVLIEDIYA